MSLWSWIKRKLGGTVTPARSTSLEYYRNLYNTMSVLPKHKGPVDLAVLRIKKSQDRYVLAAEMVNKAHSLKVNWKVIACIHSLEASGDFSKNLANGQPITQRTTIVPKGLGPWESFEHSCVDAIGHERWDSVNFDDIGSILKAVEGYNGMAYSKMGKNSPYLWSFSNHGIGVGKYIRDHVYSPTAVSSQIGWSILYKELSK